MNVDGLRFDVITLPMATGDRHFDVSYWFVAVGGTHIDVVAFFCTLTSA